MTTNASSDVFKMARFVLVAVFVTLYSVSQASEHQCRNYYVDGIEHQGLYCPQFDSDKAEGKTYCCQTITGDIIEEECCTKTDWENNPDSNPNLWSTEAVIGLCIGAGVVVVAIVAAVIVTIRRRRRRTMILATRTAAQAAVLGAVPPPCEQPARVGQYRQF